MHRRKPEKAGSSQQQRQVPGRSVEILQFQQSSAAGAAKTFTYNDGPELTPAVFYFYLRLGTFLKDNMVLRKYIWYNGIE